MSYKPKGFKDGRRHLSNAEKQRIEDLAQRRPGIKAGTVARILERDEGTIHWHMMNRGMLHKVLRYGRKEPYMRGNIKCWPWTRDEDLRALQLRVEGLRPGQIAPILNAEFGKTRSEHTVDVRLKMLAAYENSPEDVES
jgi:hypothetical protein